MEELAIGATMLVAPELASRFPELPVTSELPESLFSENAAHRLMLSLVVPLAEARSVFGRLTPLRFRNALPMLRRQPCVMATLELFTLLLTNRTMPPVPVPLTAVTCRVLLRIDRVLMFPLPRLQALSVVNVGVASVFRVVVEANVVMVFPSTPPTPTDSPP